LMRAREILPENAAGEFWEKGNWEGPGPKQQEALVKLQQEEGAVVESLLGGKADPQLVIDRVFGQTDHRLAELGWLAPAKREAAQKALREAGLRSQEAAVAGAK
jgi:hypothetical protein